MTLIIKEKQIQDLTIIMAHNGRAYNVTSVRDSGKANTTIYATETAAKRRFNNLVSKAEKERSQEHEIL